MSLYRPEEWVIVKINGPDPHYRVFGSWGGGYASGDHWRMNSGIISVREDGNHYIFNGSSGSIYICHKKAYGVKSTFNAGVLLDYEKQGKKLGKGKKLFKIFKAMPDIMNMNWLIKT